MTSKDIERAARRPAKIESRTILNMVCEGKSVNQIALVCHLSPRTIEARLVILRAKNHCVNLPALVHKYTLYAHNITHNFYL